MKSLRRSAGKLHIVECTNLVIQRKIEAIECRAVYCIYYCMANENIGF